MDFHAIIEVPQGKEAASFCSSARVGRLRRHRHKAKVLALLRGFRATGSPNILPPGTPKERVQILQEAMRKTFKDPEFHKEFKKLAGDQAAPLMPEELEKAIRGLPREREVIDFFKKLSSAEPLPTR